MLNMKFLLKEGGKINIMSNGDESVLEYAT